jgi:hypothetical protein
MYERTCTLRAFSPFDGLDSDGNIIFLQSASTFHVQHGSFLSLPRVCLFEVGVAVQAGFVEI